MEMTYFAFENGYAESILRGLRSGFLNQQHYNQIRNCSTLPEMKSVTLNNQVLEDTDYGPYLISESQNIPVSLLRSKLKKKLAQQMDYIVNNCTGVLTQFIQIIMIKYQIDNVVNMIQGSKNKVDFDLLLSNIDPLGYFPEIKNLKVLEGDDFTGLYRQVLIDTPVGPYFMRFLQQAMQSSQNKNMNQIQAIFAQMKPEFIRSSLKKLWLQDFYDFCTTKLNPTSIQMMQDLVKFEADCKSIQVVFNSIGNKDINNMAKVIMTRKQLCPALGYLYPDSQKLMLNAINLDQLKDAVKSMENYKELLKDAPDPAKMQEFSVATRTLDDLMYDEQCRKYALAFDQANQLAVFYSYLKLKQQQVRNIIWLAQMVARKLPKNHPGWKKVIIPFSHLHR